MVFLMKVNCRSYLSFTRDAVSTFGTRSSRRVAKIESTSNTVKAHTWQSHNPVWEHPLQLSLGRIHPELIAKGSGTSLNWNSWTCWSGTTAKTSCGSLHVCWKFPRSQRQSLLSLPIWHQEQYSAVGTPRTLATTFNDNVWQHHFRYFMTDYLK